MNDTTAGLSPAFATKRSLVTHGFLAGLAGTQALDAVSTWLYEAESPLDRFRENNTRGFLHAYERAVGRIAERFGKRLSRKEKQVWGWRFHKAFGFGGGLLYVALRRRFPVVARGNGLAFGAAFFLLVDELLMPATGLTPGPRAFAAKVHARGAVSHIAWGVAAETAIRLAERFQKRLTSPAQ
jgi:putative membrane protein